MRRLHDPRPERRYLRDATPRHAVAAEAARLLYTREHKEYFQAKREAARRHATTVLPTNSEIHRQLLLLADKLEGEQRQQRLRAMRDVAREMMTLLEPFAPLLIGSTWSGHIRHGSDIDLNLYGDDPDAVAATLQRASIPFSFERVQSRKHGQEREFLHFHVDHDSGLAVEITLYSRRELNVHPTCSITGGPMARGTLAELVALLEQTASAEVEPVAPAARAQPLYPLQLQALLPELPELAACRGVPQNDAHHLDVYGHSVAVAETLDGYLQDGFARFAPWDVALRQHLASGSTAGWSRASLWLLAALCHDLGKPATQNRQPNGRITFAGHERVSETVTREIAARWQMPAEAADRVARLVAMHRLPLRFVSSAGAPSVLYEMFVAAGDLLPELVVLAVADVASARGPAQPAHRLEEQTTFAVEMLEEFFEQGFLRFPNTPVSATDLEWELGITEAAVRVQLLHQLNGLYVDGEFQGREDGLVVASELWETMAVRDGALGVQPETPSATTG